MIDTSPDGILIHQEGKILFANPVCIKLLEATKSADLIGKKVYDLIVPEDVKEAIKRMKLLYKNKTIPAAEVKIKTLKGNFKTIEVRSLLIEYNGKPAVQGIFYDTSIQKQLLKEQIRLQVVEESNKLLQKEIHERKLAEEKMHVQSAKMYAIIESSAHIVWTADREGCLSSFNKNFEKYFQKNYGIKIKIGMSIIGRETISSLEHNNFWKEKIKNAFTGKPQHFETKLINKYGTTSWLEMFLNPILDDNGKPVEISGIGHDITDKKESEELITQSLNEKEILLKEVHHRVKNNLQLVSSILNLQSSYVKDENILNVLKDSQNRIKSMSFIHESLYQNKNFSNINFSEYVTELSKNLVHSYSNYEGDVKLKLDIQNVFLNLDLAIPCGLIINEILSNALKYSFVEITGKEELSVKMIVKGDDLILMIGDNGRGLPQEIDFKNTDSLGLQIVTTLVEQLSGTIELDTAKKGTNYSVRFKHNQVKNRV
jgi:PAS domain S-box-containing protein